MLAHRPTNRHYGWIQDVPDLRDHMYASSLATLPPSVDWSNQCPPVVDQLNLRSCSANAIASAIAFEQIKQCVDTAFFPSRLFIYYNEREVEGTTNSDNGAKLRNGFQSVCTQGVCPEADWPYDTSKVCQKPPQDCYTSALHHRVLRYKRLVQSLAELKGCLAEGFPFIFGFMVYQNFITADATGIASLPSLDDVPVDGHAAMAVGYNDDDRRFLVLNSRGSTWGTNGYFTIPYEYLTNPMFSSDFWTIRLI